MSVTSLFLPSFGWKGKALSPGIVTSLDASRLITPYRLGNQILRFVHEEDLAKLQVLADKPKSIALKIAPSLLNEL
jgi:hypothetical protein